MKKQKPKPKKKIILGLTGGLGSGKTYVAKIFRLYAAQVIDADNIAHSIIRPGKKTYKRVVKSFGRQILNKDKTINRSHLARVIFSDKKLLFKLNRIMHPEIIRIMPRVSFSIISRHDHPKIRKMLNIRLQYKRIG